MKRRDFLKRTSSEIDSYPALYTATGEWGNIVSMTLRMKQHENQASITATNKLLHLIKQKGGKPRNSE